MRIAESRRWGLPWRPVRWPHCCFRRMLVRRRVTVSSAESAARALRLPDGRSGQSRPRCARRPERLDWHFVPRDRVGISLLTLDGEQSELLGPLLATALSPEACSKRAASSRTRTSCGIETAGGRTHGVAPRSRPVLHQRVRQSVGYRALGLALRGAPPVPNVTRLPAKPPAIGPLFIRRIPRVCLRGRGGIPPCWPPRRTWRAHHPAPDEAQGCHHRQHRVPRHRHFQRR